MIQTKNSKAIILILICFVFSNTFFCKATIHDEEIISERRSEHLTELSEIEERILFEKDAGKSKIENFYEQEPASVYEEPIPIESKVEKIPNPELQSECKEKLGGFIFTLPIYKGNIYTAIKELTYFPDGFLFFVSQKSAGKLSKTSTYAVDFDGKIMFHYAHPLPQKYAYFITTKDYFFEFLIGTVHSTKPDIEIRKRAMDTGNVLWKFVVSGTSQYPVHSQLRAALNTKLDQLIVAHDDFFISAYKIKSPYQKLWTYKSKEAILCAPAIDKTSTIYTCSQKSKVIALSSKGKELWKVTHYLPNRQAQHANVSLNPYKQLMVRESGVFGFYQADNGKELWKSTQRTFTSGAVSIDKTSWLTMSGQVVLYSSDGKLLSFSKRNYKKYLPTLLQDGSAIIASYNGLSHFSNKGKLIKQFVFPDALPVESEAFGLNSVYLQACFAYIISLHTASGQIGILRFRSALPPINQKGWPSVDGNMQRHRMVQ